jgi:hypothetical protein
MGFGYGERNAIYKTNKGVPGPGAYFEQEREYQKSSHSPASSNFGKSPRNIQQVTNPLGPG